MGSYKTASETSILKNLQTLVESLKELIEETFSFLVFIFNNILNGEAS